jgi:glycosyltransferase involved in cell wall biosynthesis
LHQPGASNIMSAPSALHEPSLPVTTATARAELPAISDRKTVLVVRSELLPYSETFVKEQAQAYRHWRPVLVGLKRIAGLPVEDMDIQLLPSTRSLPGRAYRKVLRSLHIAPPGIRRRLLPQSASLIHVHFGTDAVDHWDWIRSFDVPVVVTLHGYDINIYKQWWQLPTQSPAQRRYPGRLLQLASDPRVHFVAVSSAIKERALEWGLPAGRISVHYIGVDLSNFRPAGPPIERRPPRILFVGRLVEKKGVEYLIRAFELVKAQVPAAELVIVGDGPLRPKLEQLAVQLKLGVTFLGGLSSPQIKAELQKTRMLCSPSVTAENGDAEGLPIVILEAQACGIPVITSARGGAGEGIIDGVTGFAFSEKDIGSLSNHILHLLQDARTAASMGLAGRHHMEERFDLDSCTRLLEGLYDNLAHSHSTGVVA